MRFSIKTEDPKVRAISITILCVILVSSGQALMKFGFGQSEIPGKIEFTREFIGSFFSSFLATPWILLGYFLATISAILFLEALHKAEFGITAAVFRLNYIIAYIIGIIYFGETFKVINLIGLLLIFSGVAVISLSEEKRSSC